MLKQSLIALSLLPSSASELERLWPEGVTMPPTLRPYRKTEYGQRLTVTNGLDQNLPWHIHQNDHNGQGNREFPWRVPGGLDNATGWASHTGIAIPEGQYVRYWTERIEAGAPRPLPKVTWSFPVGTRVYDLLTHRGQAFELRMLRKERDRWVGHTLWQGEDWPPGYRGVKATGRTCMGCHSKAGAWERYGPLVRGNDFVFSFTAFKEGTLEIDRTKFPVKHWDEK